MNDIVFVENFESLKELKSNFPDEFFLKTSSRLTVLSIDYLMLNKGNVTWRSPPSAYSISTQSSLV